jgi:hypothetical protein
MAWPADVADGQIIAAAHINAIKNSVATWQGNVDAGQFALNNLSAVNVQSADGVYQTYFVAQTAAAQAGMAPGITLASSGNVLNLLGGITTGAAVGGVNVAFFASGWCRALSIRNVGGGAPVAGNLLLMPDGGNVQMASGWNTGHLILAPWHIWVEGNGRLRIKNGAPVSDTDGTIVGSQA